MEVVNNSAADIESILVTTEGAEELIADEKVVSFKKDMRYYKNYLLKEDLSPATIKCYMGVANKFFEDYRAITKLSLLKWRAKLMEDYSPRGVNQKIHAMNKYLTYINRRGLKLRSVKVQQRTFVDNVVSFDDYQYFLKMLKRDNDKVTYFMVKFIACTGARVSELTRFKVEDVRKGYMDIIGKGRKYRRLYIPVKLQKEALRWLEDEQIEYGPIFTYRDNPIKSSGVNSRLKRAASKYPKLPLECIYPHSFRHMYAKKLISNGVDLLLLSDLMGHSNLEVTRIYTRLSSTEQKEVVDKLVTW